MRRPSISVFFPCYNDKGTIATLVWRSDELLKKICQDYEILVIDDGSTDGSRELLRELSAKIKKLRLVFHEVNRGYGAVLCSGFSSAKHELVFYTDGDGQYDVRELELLVHLMTNDIDVVNGIKMERNDPWIRIAAGKGYNFFVRNLFGIKISDVDCDFRLIRRRLLRQISLKSHSGAICVELVKKLQDCKARFREVTVHHYDRVYGHSQFFRPKKLFETAIELTKLWGHFYIR